MKTPPEPPPSWEPLEPGWLPQVAKARQGRLRRRAALRKLGVGLGAGVLLGAGWALWDRRTLLQGPDYGGLACHEVVRQLPDYLQQRLAEPVRQQMETHLAHCPKCQAVLRRMQAAASGTASA